MDNIYLNFRCIFGAQVPDWSHNKNPPRRFLQLVRSASTSPSSITYYLFSLRMVHNRLVSNKLLIHGKCCFSLLPLFKTISFYYLSKIKYLAFFITFCFIVSLAKMVTLTNKIVYKKIRPI